MLVGYARVSSAGESLNIQREQLAAAGCERLFEEKRIARTARDRWALKDALAFTREGDTLVVTRLDRVARSITELREIVDGLSARGVGFRCLQQGALDTTRSDGDLLLNILRGFAEFEADNRKERQREGIEKAKEAGRYRGRKPTIDPVAIRQAIDEGEKPAALAKRLGVARSSVYRVKDAQSAS